MNEAVAQAGFPILSLVTFLPLAGALYIALFMEAGQTERIRRVALGVSLATFLLSLMLWAGFDAETGAFQWVERYRWIDRFGIHYLMGVDGISLLLVLMTTFITVICVLSSWSEIRERVKAYMALFLVVETGCLGVFMALDLFLFYVFWEVVLIPMVFIIGVWGGARRLYSAIKFFLFTFTGSLFMLLGLIALYHWHGKMTGIYTFDAGVLFRTPVPAHVQGWVFLAFLAGFAVKVPMFPLHTWLPDAHTEAPTAGSIVLAAVLLKLGTYGFVRFSLPLLPAASVQFAPLMILLSMVAILYGAAVTLAQRDMKKLVAYSSVSHMGFVMLGVFLLNREGLQGGILQMVNHGVATGALFLLVGMAYERTHTRDIRDYGGILGEAPFFGLSFLVILLSSMGMPGTGGFIGELYVVVGAFRGGWYYALLVVVGILLGAAYLLWLYQRVFLGAPSRAVSVSDLGLRERVAVLPMIGLVFWIGLYPKPFLGVMDVSVDNLLSVVESGAAEGGVAAEKGRGEALAALLAPDTESRDGSVTRNLKAEAP